MFKECTHDWEIVAEKTMESPAEVAKSVGLHAQSAYDDHFQRKYILVLKCVKCGKLDKTIIENP